MTERVVTTWEILQEHEDQIAGVQETVVRIEQKLDALIKALKAHGVGAWTE